MITFLLPVLILRTSICTETLFIVVGAYPVFMHNDGRSIRRFQISEVLYYKKALQIVPLTFQSGSFYTRLFVL